MVKPKRIIFPPMYMAFCLLAMWGLQRWLPIVEYDSLWSKTLGGLLILLGLIVTGWSAGLFGKAKTPLIPFTRSTAVVTTGPYKITRNPMYLGMALMLSGMASWFGALSAWLPVPLFIWVIQTRFIVDEERMMEELFGEEFLAYKRTVRRWL